MDCYNRWWSFFLEKASFENRSQVFHSKEDLSQVSNEQLEKNFKHFLNQYRIEAAKEKMQDPRENQFVLLKIAFDVGFNSKSGFNASFKKITGLTPSQFRKQNNNSEQKSHD